MRFKNICLTAMMLFGICAVENRAQESFLKGYSYTSSVSDVLETGDGGYLVTSIMRRNFNDTLIWGIGVLKTRSNGDVEWFRFIRCYEGYYNSARLSPIETIQTRDGGFCMGGQLIAKNQSDESIRQGFLLKINSKGDVLWAKKYTDTTYKYSIRDWAVTHFTESTTGELVAVANFRHENPDTPTKNYLRTIFAADSLGNVLWSKGYNIDVRSSHIRETPNSSFITAGPFGMFKINRKGDFLWSKLYGNARIHKTFPLKSGGYIIDGYRFENNYYYPIVMRADDTGAVQWAKIFRENDAQKTKYYGGLDILKSGKFILTGSSEPVKDSSNPWIMMLDTSGAILSATQPFKNGYVGNAVSTGDGGFVIQGAYTTNDIFATGFPPFLLKTDSTANIDCFKTQSKRSFTSEEFLPVVKDSVAPQVDLAMFAEDIPVEAFLENVGSYDLCGVVGIEDINDILQFSISPNPASQTVTISLKETPPTADISIIDITGRTLYRTFLKDPGQKIRLDISPLLKGIYFVKVSADGREYTQKLIVE